MEEYIKIFDCFEKIETTREYSGYFYSVSEAILIAILGSFCKLQTAFEIWKWASSERVKIFLKQVFKVRYVPSYPWFLELLSIIKPESMNECFVKWVKQFLPESMLKNLTVSFDGKTIRSTKNMKNYESALHIVSAQICELGITLAQRAVEGKTNEIPTVQALMGLLDIKGAIVVADALNCQKETANQIVSQGADYLLSVKDNQKNLKKDIEDYIQDKKLRKLMRTAKTKDFKSDRTEVRKAFVTYKIDWLYDRSKWKNVCCIGAINTQFKTKSHVSNEWHYYISSKNLTAKELLKHARSEWAVESMHWLLDVHYREDFCRIANKNVQKNLNMMRKFAINCIRNFKNSTGSKKSFSDLMFDCLLDCNNILNFFPKRLQT